MSNKARDLRKLLLSVNDRDVDVSFGKHRRAGLRSEETTVGYHVKTVVLLKRKNSHGDAISEFLRDPNIQHRATVVIIGVRSDSEIDVPDTRRGEVDVVRDVAQLEKLISVGRVAVRGS